MCFFFLFSLSLPLTHSLVVATFEKWLSTSKVEAESMFIAPVTAYFMHVFILLGMSFHSARHEFVRYSKSLHAVLLLLVYISTFRFISDCVAFRLRTQIHERVNSHFQYTTLHSSLQSWNECRRRKEEFVSPCLRS